MEANRIRLLVAAGLVLLAAGVISFVVWQKDQDETTASLALTQAMLSASPGDNAAQAYLKVAVEYPGTPAAARALLQAATRFYTANQFGQALKQFRNFLHAYPNSPFADQAALGVAACLDAQGQSDAAIEAYQNVINQYSGANVTAEAKFSLAHLYDAKGQLKEARNLYQDVAQSDQYSSLGQEAAVRLQELNLHEPLSTVPVQRPPAAPGTFVLSSTNLPSAQPAKAAGAQKSKKGVR